MEIFTDPQSLKCTAHVPVNRNGKYFSGVLSIHKDNVVSGMDILP